MSRRNSQSIISIVILILCVILLIGFLARLSNISLGGSESSFYVLHDGTKYIGDNNDVIVTADETERFDVKSSGEFNVKVVPNAEKDFIYRLGTQEKKFSGLKDSTFDKYFSLKKSSNYFTVCFSSNLTLIDILQDYYAASNEIVTFPTEINIASNLYFTLIVESTDEKQTVEINFGLHVSVEGLKLDKTEIAF